MKKVNLNAVKCLCLSDIEIYKRVVVSKTIFVFEEIYGCFQVKNTKI